MRVPKLRFPGFLNIGWMEKRIEDVAPLQRGFDLPSDQIKSGNIPVVYSNGVQNFHSMGMAKAPGLITGRSGTIGKIHFIEEGDYWPHNTSLWVTSFKGNFPKFIYYLYKSIGMIRFASGSGVPTLNRNYVHAFQTYLPPSILEQQKIADCLASLDELIAAQTQKLGTLKTHKKSLMQQLFPAEGETVPKLRFPEFQGLQEWDIQKLAEVCIRIMDGTHFSPQSKSGPNIYLTSKNIRNGFIDLSDVSYISSEEHEKIYSKCPAKKNDVLLTKDGANTGNCAINNIESEFSLLSSVAVLRANPLLLDCNFLYQSISSEIFQKLIRNSMSGQAITRITLEKIAAYSISIPTTQEQQKIANCLSSLDELITAQTQKLDSLKTHKKGLMQQLFPAVDEVVG